MEKEYIVLMELHRMERLPDETKKKKERFKYIDLNLTSGNFRNRAEAQRWLEYYTEFYGVLYEIKSSKIIEKEEK